jgi:hypothetical protein
VCIAIVTKPAGGIDNKEQSNKHATQTQDITHYGTNINIAEGRDGGFA